MREETYRTPTPPEFLPEARAAVESLAEAVARSVADVGDSSGSSTECTNPECRRGRIYLDNPDDWVLCPDCREKE